MHKRTVGTALAAALLVALVYSYLQCPVCKGTGWEQGRKCHFCDGDGKVGDIP